MGGWVAVTATESGRQAGGPGGWVGEGVKEGRILTLDVDFMCNEPF